MDDAKKEKDDAKAELDEAKQRVKQLGAISSKTADDVAALAEAKAAVERLTKTYNNSQTTYNNSQTIYAALLVSFNNATELVTKRKFETVCSVHRSTSRIDLPHRQQQQGGKCLMWRQVACFTFQQRLAKSLVQICAKRSKCIRV
jgi:hypothetical protein